MRFQLYEAPICKDIHAREVIDKAKYILSTAPDAVRNVPMALNAMNMQYRPSFNNLVLLGAPGGGKTEIARSIAILSGWNIYQIGEEQLNRIGSQRNHSTAHYMNILSIVEEDENKAIIIFDEMNGLLENHDSAHHDTDTLSRAIWKSLSKNSENKNIFFISTMNRMDRIPIQLKDRLLYSVVKIDGFGSLDDANTCLLRSLRVPEYSLSQDDSTYLLQRFEPLNIRYPRNIELLAQAIKYRSFCSVGNCVDAIAISRASIDSVFNERLLISEEIKLNKTHESDEERRHKESMQLQKEQMVMRKEDREIENKKWVLSHQLSAAGMYMSEHTRQPHNRKRFEEIDRVVNEAFCFDINKIKEEGTQVASCLIM